jgi:hypothetical protein
MNSKDKHADWLLKPTANELANELERPNNWQQKNNFTTRAATMLRQQQAEIEALKAENKFFKDLMSDVEILRKASEK